MGGLSQDESSGMKYWNRRASMPTIPTYLFECMVLDYYAAQGTPSASKWVDMEIPALLSHVSTAIWRPVYDPKGIQGDLNTVSIADRLKIAEKAGTDATTARDARAAEAASDDEKSLRLWRQVLGYQL